MSAAREPKIEVVEDEAALAPAAADVVAAVIAADPSATVVVATGETPLGCYAELSRRREAGALDTSDVTIVQLDEYLGLEPGDRRSLFGWMRRALLEPLAIPDDHVLRLPTDGEASASAAFERALDERGGVDLAILGLGDNGHLFNEPPAAASSATRSVELTAATIAANARYWGTAADVPPTAITLGLRQLLGARRILLLVSGARKHEIVHRALEGPVGEDVPASLVRGADAEVTVIVDRAAWNG